MGCSDFKQISMVNYIEGSWIKCESYPKIDVIIYESK